MYLLRRELTQVILIILVNPDVELVIDEAGIFFLEYLLEDALGLVSFFILLAIVSHLVDEEQRQALNATLEQFLFFIEV